MDFKHNAILYVTLNLSIFLHICPLATSSFVWAEFKHKVLHYLKHNDSPGYSISFPGSKTADQLLSAAYENANYTFNKT